MEDLQKILQRVGVGRLNKMQVDAYDKISNTVQDVVVISPTGSGKTLAYMLPLLGMMDKGRNSLQAIVIVPNRELARQSAAVMDSLRTGVKAVCCYGGRPSMEEHRIIRDVEPQVIFGTPGRLNDHLDKGNISPYTVKYVVIDEFDKCVEMGFQGEMSRLLKRLGGVMRRFLFSATDAEQIPSFVSMGSMIKLDYSISGVSSRVAVFCLKSKTNDKMQTVADLLCTLGSKSSIVFLNYRDSVERVSRHLAKRGFSVSMLHGGMEQEEREMSLFKFSNGSNNILVSTDLASRGLDIPEVDNIIHYHLPLNKESYIHRVGRTARWMATGCTYFVLSPDEYMPDFVEEKCDEFTLPEQIPSPMPSTKATIYIGKGKKDKISKGDVVGFLCKNAGLNASEIGQIDVRDRFVYAVVPQMKLSQVLSMTSGKAIKGIKTIVDIIK